MLRVPKRFHVVVIVSCILGVVTIRTGSTGSLQSLKETSIWVLTCRIQHVYSLTIRDPVSLFRVANFRTVPSTRSWYILLSEHEHDTYHPFSQTQSPTVTTTSIVLTTPHVFSRFEVVLLVSLCGSSNFGHVSVCNTRGMEHRHRLRTVRFQHRGVVYRHDIDCRGVTNDLYWWY